MIETVILILFALALVTCAVFSLPLIPALLMALVAFLLYGLHKKHRLSILLKSSWSGIRTASGVLIALTCIGLLTATWRASGTIAFVVWECINLVPPAVMLLGTFLLCCLVSLLTGTSFGTASTMGVICASVAFAQGLPDLLVGGAVLAGCYFGDRCSPLSTSALLVGQVTRTKVMDNIPDMLRTALVPFLVSCTLYLLLGFLFLPTDAGSGFASVERAVADTVLSWWTVIPVVLALGLAILRVDIRVVLLISALSAGVIAVVLQGVPITEVLIAGVMGYQPASDAELFAGGGIVSMLETVVIVMISCCYAGIFEITGFLDNMTGTITRLAQRTNSFVGFFISSLITSIIACNQTLAIMLSQQLCKNIPVSDHQRAINLENTVVVMAALVPWSIAGAVPLAIVGADLSGMASAFFLYLLPLWCLLRSRKSKA